MSTRLRRASQSLVNAVRFTRSYSKSSARRHDLAASLPDDILLQIFTFLESTPTLWKAELCMLCRRWNLAATVLLYTCLEPSSLRSLRKLCRTIEEHPYLAAHTKSLVFPHFIASADPLAHGLRDTYQNHLWYKCDRSLSRGGDPVRLLQYVWVHLRLQDLELLVSLFLDLAGKFENLRSVQMPFFAHRHDAGFYEPFMKSVRNLVLLMNPYASRYDATDAEDLPMQLLEVLPNVETLVLCGFNDIQNYDLTKAKPRLLPRLTNLQIEYSVSTIFADQLIALPGVDNLVVWQEYLLDGDDWIDLSQMPLRHSPELQLDITQLTVQVGFRSAIPFGQFSSLKHLTIALRHLYPEIFETLPKSLTTLHFAYAGLTPDGFERNEDPYSTCRILKGAKEQLRLLPHLRTLGVRWKVWESQLEIWTFLGILLSDIFRESGIEFFMALVLCPNELRPDRWYIDRPSRWSQALAKPSLAHRTSRKIQKVVSRRYTVIEYNIRNKGRSTRRSE